MKKLTFIFLLLSTACNRHHTEEMTINLVVDSASVKISGLDNAIINDINRDTSADWQSLIPIYRMPADTDMKNYQPLQAGKYRVENGGVTFTPDTPFQKTQTYFVRYYQYGIGDSAWDYIKHSHKPGKAPFTDLIFKP